MSRFTIGTRFFGKDPAKDLPRIATFIEAGQKIGKVLVAVNTAEDKCDTIGYCAANFPDADVFAVTPWQKFVAPLNAIVYRAALTGSDRLLLASAEFAPKESDVASLAMHVHAGTLVAGARLVEHDWKGGMVEGTGLTVPWNTFALWNLDHLAKFGFALAGDAPFDPTTKQAGVEEVVAIALYQKLSQLSAKLVSIPGFYKEWNFDGWDQARLDAHHAKLAAKLPRPAAQLKWAGLSAPTIEQVG